MIHTNRSGIFSKPILSLPRWAKRLLVLAVDTSSCVLTVWVAYYLRLGEFVSLSEQALLPVFLAITFALPIFSLFGLYQAIFRFSGLSTIVTVGRATGIYAILYAAVLTAIGFEGIPRTIGLIQPMLLFLIVSASRVFASTWLGGADRVNTKERSLSRVFVYGAGQTGRELAAGLNNSGSMQLVGFLDDDDSLHGNSINGVKVYDPADLIEVADSLAVKYVFIAIPSLTRQRRNRIIEIVRSAHVAVRVLPSFGDLASGKVSVTDLREPDIDDLLGRDSVDSDHSLLEKNVRHKVVLITGAGGSIGSELCRQVMAFCPKTLVLLEQGEFALYSINRELSEKFVNSPSSIFPLLGSVRDRTRVREIISVFRPDIIYHAAAYKHVPLVEQNPIEGIRNNVFGTLVVCESAIDFNVSQVVLISTDKAVRPTNVMGASKRLSEMILQALSKDSNLTRFSIVRFGNVLGSSGSVVPKFRDQIKNGGPITLTDENVSRYFMTIPEAAQLVLQASALAEDGGNVFVLDMGTPIKILELARRMVELSGLTIRDESNIEGDIEIKIIGLRPGEKLHEELLIGESPEPTGHSKIIRAKEEFIEWKLLRAILTDLESALNAGHLDSISDILRGLVKGYIPSSEIQNSSLLK